MIIRTLIIAFSLGFGSLGSVSADDTEGAKLYKRCSACHLPTGKGVPGAFPPLKNSLSAFYGTPEGRSYLTMVVAKGLNGPIDVGGVTYRGFMPAQGSALKDKGIASVLNYILLEFHDNGAEYALFTEAEVKTVKAESSGVKARDLSKKRRDLMPVKAGE